MKKLFGITLAFVLALSMLTACDNGNASTSPSISPSASPSADAGTTPSPNPSQADLPQDGENGNIPAGVDVISQGVYYYELYEVSGDIGDGATPREGADLIVQDVLTPEGFFDLVGLDQCVYISFDDVQALDSAMGRECYIYSVAVGTVEGGLTGDDYQVVYRASVAYSTWTAAIFEDFSGGMGDLVPDDSGRGDLVPDEGGRGDLVPDDRGDGDQGDAAIPNWDGVYAGDEFSMSITNFNGTSFFDFEIYLLRDGSSVFEGKAAISPDTDFTAEYGEMSFILYGDGSAVELAIPQSSEWAHLGDAYKRIQ